MANEFVVQTHLASSQVDGLMELYHGEWWTRARTRSDVERMLSATSLLFAVVEQQTGVLAAFARVLTDRTYIALVLDVIVAPAFRNRGLGGLLMQSICGDPRLADVRSVELVCQPELFEFYRCWGFTENVGRSHLMRRTSDPALTSPANQQVAGSGDAKR